MPIRIQVGPVLAVDGRSSVDVNPMVEFLRAETERRGMPREFALRLAEVLYELQIFSQTLETILRLPIPVEGEFIEILGPNGEVVAQLGQEALVFAKAPSTAALSAFELRLVDNAGGEIILTVDGSGNQVLQMTGAAGYVQALVNATDAYVDTSGEYRVSGTKVLGVAPAAPPAIATAAGATYGATEQAAINTLIARFNDLRTILTTQQPILTP